jgi:hypothetical protein
MGSKYVTIQGVMTYEDEQPPYPSQGPGFPTHPIAPGGPPPVVWPGPGVPTHPIYLPPGVNVPVFPTHPIALPPTWGGQPPSIWPSPGVPTHPIYLPPGIWPSPGVPTHPIAPGGPPPGYWGGAPLPVPTPPIYYPTPPLYPSQGPGFPTHPIVIPPEQPKPPEGSGGVPVTPIAGVPVGDKFVGYWSPAYGWVLVPAAGPIGSGESLPESPETPTEPTPKR